MTARLVDLADIRNFVRQAAFFHGGTAPAVDDLLVAVNEAVTNIIVHGYREKPGPLTISVSHEDHTLSVCLSDQAPAFNPLSVPAPDVNKPLEQRPPGGMGVLMMREFADELSYRLTPEGHNELTLIKRQTSE